MTVKATPAERDAYVAHVQRIRSASEKLYELFLEHELYDVMHVENQGLLRNKCRLALLNVQDWLTEMLPNEA